VGGDPGFVRGGGVLAAVDAGIADSRGVWQSRSGPQLSRRPKDAIQTGM
jgi:hypothetical protein